MALEQFSKLVLPTNQINQQLETTSSEYAEHVFNLIEGKNKQIVSLSADVVGAAFTYADLKKLFDRIFGSIYWKKREETANIVAAHDETKLENANEASETVAQINEPINITDQINQININMEDQLDIHKQPHHSDIHSNLPNDQG